MLLAAAFAERKATLADATINDTIVERHYQTRAIRRIGESFEKDNEPKSLLVMAGVSSPTRATGVGGCGELKEVR